MSLQAYRQTSARAESPREAEYRLFGQVTRALMDVSLLDQSELGPRMDALDWNRRMWTAFASDCAVEGNGLPQALRASIISLSLWVNRHTSLVMRGEENVQDLIDINRMIMQGLSAGSAVAA